MGLKLKWLNDPMAVLGFLFLQQLQQLLSTTHRSTSNTGYIPYQRPTQISFIVYKAIGF